MTFEAALAQWVAKREDVPTVAITDVFVDSMTEGGECGNGTCWFDGDVVISFKLSDAREGAAWTYWERVTRTYGIGPGNFIAEVAAIAKEENP